jgi:hypothetical protein
VSVSVLVAVGAVLVIQHGSSSPASAVRSPRGHAQPGWNGHPEGQTRPAEKLWSGEVALLLNRPYGLQERPVRLVEPCGGCLRLETLARGEVALHADNGILRWPKQSEPSYYDCVHLRESGTEDYVSLATPSHEAGLRAGGWMCATGGGDSIVRLRYEGWQGGGAAYRFNVTAWHRPFV